MGTLELNNSVCGAKKGPKLTEKGPNKVELTCTKSTNPRQNYPLEPRPGAVSNRFNGLLWGLGNGRGERIRTSGLYVPNVALYQAKLHPDTWAIRFCAAQKDAELYQHAVCL